jgi:hypothetical protein
LVIETFQLNRGMPRCLGRSGRERQENRGLAVPTGDRQGVSV